MKYYSKIGLELSECGEGINLVFTDIGSGKISKQFMSFEECKEKGYM